MRVIRNFYGDEIINDIIKFEICKQITEMHANRKNFTRYWVFKCKHYIVMATEFNAILVSPKVLKFYSKTSSKLRSYLRARN